MIIRLSGALTAIFVFIFFVLSTLSPIEQSITDNAAVFSSSSPIIHTDFSALEVHTPINYEEVRAMWFPYFEYRNILQGKTRQEFAANIRERFQNAKDLGINTVYVHVRAHGDAYYYSGIFPMAARCSGTLGTKISFDPLEIMTDTAHSLGLSFHAWVNPLRLMSADDINLMSDDYILKQWYNDPEKNGTYIVEYSGVYYLNPAYYETRQLVTDGIEEILHNYDIDGIHIDDYFYPTTDISFDSDAFASSGSTDLNLWRYSNTNALVSEIFSTVKSYDQNILFGISPAATDNANKSLYADVDLWCAQNGYCDYIVPQIYFGYTNETAPFDNMLSIWKQKCADSDIKLIIGICTYKYAEDKDEWSDADLSARQLESVIGDKAFDGAAIYSYSSTFEPESNAQLLYDVRCSIKTVLAKENI
ncbi:MAG: family 10 glycosylhydrolase [Oscillospiraceae bacterium]|nr:family 10 glycosylhydrolase [Oscillospiraceae bacterium]